MRPFILTIFLTYFFIQASYSQTLNAYLKGADDALAKKDYFSAYSFLRTAHEIEPNNTEIPISWLQLQDYIQLLQELKHFIQKLIAVKKQQTFRQPVFGLDM
jgi:hypothetical protein